MDIVWRCKFFAHHHKKHVVKIVITWSDDTARPLKKTITLEGSIAQQAFATFIKKASVFLFSDRPFISTFCSVIQSI